MHEQRRTIAPSVPVAGGAFRRAWDMPRDEGSLEAAIAAADAPSERLPHSPHSPHATTRTCGCVGRGYAHSAAGCTHRHCLTASFAHRPRDGTVWGGVQVDEIMGRKKAKDAARERFKEYDESKCKGTLAGQTDYGAWELWCPSDEASAPPLPYHLQGASCRPSYPNQGGLPKYHP